MIDKRSLALPIIQQGPRRIHSKAESSILLPSRYPAFNLQKTEPTPRFGPIRIDPRVTQMFGKRSIAINMNDFVELRMRMLKQLRIQNQQRDIRKRKYLQEKASIAYFQDDD